MNFERYSSASCPSKETLRSGFWTTKRLKECPVSMFNHSGENHGDQEGRDAGDGQEVQGTDRFEPGFSLGA